MHHNYHTLPRAPRSLFFILKTLYKELTYTLNGVIIKLEVKEINKNREEKTMTKQVMVRAWEIARKGQEQFGGNVSEYLSEAMKMAWAIEKGTVTMTIKRTMNEIAEELQSNLNTVKVNVWENYGKRRIYVNKGFKNQVIMLEFDQDDNCLTDLDFGGTDWMAASQNEVYDELKTIVDYMSEVA